MKRTKRRAPFLPVCAICLLLLSGGAYAAPPDLTLTNSDIVFSSNSPEPGEVVAISATVRNNGGIYLNTAPYSKHDTPSTIYNAGVNVWRDYWYAQYFTVNSDMYLSKVSLYVLNKGVTTDAITVDIRNDKGFVLLPAPGSENLLASQTIVSTFTSYGWQDVVFDTPPLLSAGSTYWICAENDASNSGDGYTWWVDTSTVVNMVAVSYLLQGLDWQVVKGSYTAYYHVYQCTDTVVACYRGDPDDGGTLIGTSVFPTPIPPAGSRTAVFFWPAVNGSTDIYVTVDRQNAISESNENNNAAFKSITGAPTLPAVSGAVSPPENAIGVAVDEPVRVTFSEDMISTAAAKAVTVNVIKDNRGVSLPGELVAGAAAYSARTLTFAAPWQKGYAYRVTVSTDAEDLYGNNLAAARAWTFTTVMGPATENTIVDENVTTRITMPADAVDGDYYVVIDTKPEAEPALAGKITRANEKAQRINGAFCAPVAGGVRKLTLYRGPAGTGAPFAGSFRRNASLLIPYDEVDDGIVAGGNGRRVKEKTLAVYRLDEESNLWVKIPDSVIDTVNNTVSAHIGHFSVYALLGGSDTDLSNAYAYPVPWKPFSGESGAGSLAGGITFAGLGSEATIRIYTISGEPVKALRYVYDGSAEQQKWDGTNESGELVASGVYVYYIENSKEHRTGKLVVIK